MIYYSHYSFVHYDVILPTLIKNCDPSIKSKNNALPKSILRKSSTLNFFEFLQEKRVERQFEMTKNLELNKSINSKINEMTALVKNKKNDFYPLISTLNDSLKEMDCREDSGPNERIRFFNREYIERDLTDFERISANTLLLTNNMRASNDAPILCS